MLPKNIIIRLRKIKKCSLEDFGTFFLTVLSIRNVYRDKGVVGEGGVGRGERNGSFFPFNRFAKPYSDAVFVCGNYLRHAAGVENE